MEYREWVFGKLSAAHEPFLSERLRRVFGRLSPDFLRPMFASRSDLKSTLWRIGVWRNALTHVTADVDEIGANLRWLHVATNQLLIALKANLLLDLGFEVGDLPTRFQYDQTYRFYSSHTLSETML